MMWMRPIWNAETPVNIAARCTWRASVRERGAVVGKVWKCNGRSTSATACHRGSQTGCHIGSMSQEQDSSRPRSPILDTRRTSFTASSILPRDVLRAARPDPVDQPEIGAVFGDPLRPVRPLLDIGHPLLHLARGVLDEQLRRHARHVEVAIGGDALVMHGAVPSDGVRYG